MTEDYRELVDSVNKTKPIQHRNTEESCSMHVELCERTY